MHHSYIHPHPDRAQDQRNAGNLMICSEMQKNTNVIVSQQWHGRSMRTTCVHNDLHCQQCLFWLSVWGNTLSCLVVQVISILSTSLCCVVSRPLVFLTWSVIEELRSPGRFCLPPVVVVYKGWSPEFCVWSLCPHCYSIWDGARLSFSETVRI